MVIFLKPGDSLANVLGGEAHSAGTKEGAGDEGVLEPVDDFAALVGRGEHDDLSGNEIRSFSSETTEDDPAHGMGDKVGGLLRRGNGFLYACYDFIEGLSKGRIGDVEGFIPFFVEMPGESFHGPHTSPKSVEQDDPVTLAGMVDGAMPGKGRNHGHELDQDAIKAGWPQPS